MAQENYDQEQANIVGSGAGQSFNVTYLREHQRTGAASASLFYQGAELVPPKVDTPPNASNAKGSNMADQTREEVDAKIAASEARTDTKIVRMEGKLDIVLLKISDVSNQIQTANTQIQATDAHNRQDNRATRENAWVVGISLGILIAAIAGLIVGAVAIFPSVFGIGVQMKDIVDRSVETHIQEIQTPKK